MNRETLELVTADVEANEKLAAAKEAYRADKSERNKTRLNEAKRDIFALRSYWRGIRKYLEPDATVPTLAVKAKATKKGES